MQKTLVKCECGHIFYTEKDVTQCKCGKRFESKKKLVRIIENQKEKNVFHE